MRIKRSQAIVSISLLAFAVALSIHLIRREPTIADEAEAIVLELLDDDSDSLSKRVFEHELDYLGWDRAKASRFFREVIMPKYAGTSLDRVLSKAIVNHGATGWCTYDVRLEDGRKLRRWSYATQTDDGGNFLAAGALQEAWCVEYYRNNPTISLKNLPFMAIKSGIVQDFGKLKAFGFKGFAKLDPNESPTSLESAFENAKSYLAGAGSKER